MCRRGLFEGEAQSLEHDFDLLGAQGRRVEQGEGGRAVVAGEDAADAVERVLDGREFVFGQKMAVTDEQQVAFGEAAEGGARGGKIGGAQGDLPVGGVPWHLAQGFGKALQMALQDAGEQRVEIREVAADGGRAMAQGEGESGHGNGVPAVPGHEHLAEIDDAVSGGEISRCGRGRIAVSAGCVVAEDAGWDVHRRRLLVVVAARQLFWHYPEVRQGKGSALDPLGPAGPKPGKLGWPAGSEPGKLGWLAGLEPGKLGGGLGIVVSAYRWVPAFARGYVKDLRVRWALEEAGLPYAVELVDLQAARSAEYVRWQIFGQVPAYRDDVVSLFESGAIVLHVARRSAALAPAGEAGFARVSAWVFAALNSVEPFAQAYLQVADLDNLSSSNRDRREAAGGLLEKRLGSLSAWLGEQEYLEGPFSAGDLMMACVLRELVECGMLARFPALDAYRARCEERPAFGRALAAQLRDFEGEE